MQFRTAQAPEPDSPAQTRLPMRPSHRFCQQNSISLWKLRNQSIRFGGVADYRRPTAHDRCEVRWNAEKAKTPETRVPGVFRMSLSKTASSSSVSLWMGLRVSPLPASAFAVAGNRELSYLASRVLWCPSPRVFRLPRIPAPVNASQCVIELPQLPHLPAAPTVNLRVASNLRSVCVADWPISKFPRLSCLSALPADLFRVAPRTLPSGVAADTFPGFPGSCIYGWVMMNPNFTRTLHPSAEPQDESSRLIRRPSLPPALDADPISLRPFTDRRSQPVKGRNATEPAPYCRAGITISIPYRFINWKERLGPFNL